MWFTTTERITLAMIGTLALIGLGVLTWQRHRQPLVIEQAPTVAEAATWDAALASARRVNINTADEAALERLPQIGPGIAQRIVAYRRQHGRFLSTADLLQVRGVGEQTREAIKDYVTVN